MCRVEGQWGVGQCRMVREQGLWFRPGFAGFLHGLLCGSTKVIGGFRV